MADSPRGVKRPRPGATPRELPCATTIECPFVISVFNFKGGVGKTTIVANLAAMLAERGEGVLLVDCDSQANLTTLFLESENSMAGMTGDPEDDDDDDGNPDADVNTAAAASRTPRDDGVELVDVGIESHPLVANPLESLRSGGDVPNVEIAAGYHRHNIHALFSPMFSDGDLTSALEKAAGVGDRGYFTPPRVDCNRRLILIPGTPQLVNIEPDLARAFGGMTGDTLPSEFARYSNQLGYFREAITLCAHRARAKYVILDLGPSVGALNEMFVLSSDAVIPPIFGDRFSRSSVEGLLEDVLPRWFAHHRKILKLQNSPEGRERYKPQNEESGRYQPPGFLRFKDKPPKLLPFLLNDYAFRLGRVCAPSVHWALSISDYVRQFRARAAAVTDRSDATEKRKARVLRSMVLDGDQHRLADPMIVPFLRKDQNIMLSAHKLMRPVVWIPFNFHDRSDPHPTYLNRAQRDNYNHFRRQFTRLATFVGEVRTSIPSWGTIKYDALAESKRDDDNIEDESEPVRVGGVQAGYQSTPEPSLRDGESENDDDDDDDSSFEP